MTCDEFRRRASEGDILDVLPSEWVALFRHTDVCPACDAWIETQSVPENELDAETLADCDRITQRVVAHTLHDPELS